MLWNLKVVWWGFWKCLRICSFCCILCVCFMLWVGSVIICCEWICSIGLSLFLMSFGNCLICLFGVRMMWRSFLIVLSVCWNLLLWGCVFWLRLCVSFVLWVWCWRILLFMKFWRRWCLWCKCSLCNCVFYFVFLMVVMMFLWMLGINLLGCGCLWSFLVLSVVRCCMLEIVLLWVVMILLFVFNVLFFGWLILRKWCFLFVFCFVILGWWSLINILSDFIFF